MTRESENEPKVSPVDKIEYTASILPSKKLVMELRDYVQLMLRYEYLHKAQDIVAIGYAVPVLTMCTSLNRHDEKVTTCTLEVELLDCNVTVALSMPAKSVAMLARGELVKVGCEMIPGLDDEWMDLYLQLTPGAAAVLLARYNALKNHPASFVTKRMCGVLPMDITKVEYKRVVD